MASRLDVRLLRAGLLALSLGAPLACGGGGDDGDGSDDTDTPDGPDGPTDGDVAGTGGAGPDGGTGGAPATGGTNDPGDYIFPDGRGPLVPFSVYEAEDGETTGTKSSAWRTEGNVNSEASGRRTVRLDAPGEYVSFVNVHAANALVVRYSIPDTGDAVKKLAVLVNDQQVALLDVTARYAWSYRDANDTVFNGPLQNSPGGGRTPHHFFDDVRKLVGDIPAGATVKIQHPGGADAAASYDIDLIETELAPAPLPQPGGYKSVIDCGATPNDGTDDSAAFQNCIDNPGAGVYIPEGEFHFNNNDVDIANVNVRGAGVWYSTIRGPKASFWCWGGGCKFYDFSVFGETTARDDQAAPDDMAFPGANHSNVVIDNVWVEHRRAAVWTHGSGASGAGTNVSIKNCRFRNLHADAVNFYGGIVEGVVENCHIRNTGDDGLAIWSHAADGRPKGRNITFRHNFVMAPWKANCFGIYGGENIVIEDNVCSETTTFGGMLIANAFSSHPFTGSNDIRRNTLLRAGGKYAGGEKGAFIFEARDGNVDNIHITDLDIVEPTYFAFHFMGSDWAQRFIGYSSIDGALIDNPGSWGFYLQGNSNGAIDVANVTYQGNPGTDYSKDSGSQFTLNLGAGNVGWAP
ncbi:MAG TPA: glycosyl hydrolase family 28-related protein [Polyangiaceae bacterium]|nr:glycosyl hydrolase family 28-related protein [Polyangiaceae bacterium]